MFEHLMPWGRQINDCAEGFGSMTGGSVYNTGGPSNFTLPFMSLPINAGASRRVLTQLLCPFFTGSQKLLPLALCGGLVFELQLDAMYACFASVGDADNTAPPNWQFIQPMILVDTVPVDPALSSSYAKHLLEGKTLPISYHDFYTMQATLTDANSFSLPIQRGFSRLSAIYVTFYKAGTSFVTGFANPYVGDKTNPANRTNDTFRFQIQLGGDLKPTYQTDCVQELFYRLRMCQGIHNSTDSIGMVWADYWSGGRFIIGLNLEKVFGNDVAHTGVSTMGGQLLYINLRNIQNIQPGQATVCVVCHYDCVLSITSGRCGDRLLNRASYKQWLTPRLI
jgi:hypothetical protein